MNQPIRLLVRSRRLLIFREAGLEKRKKITAPCIAGMKAKGEKIVMLTAYDYPFGSIADAAGVDIILVGDSLGTVVQGRRNTIPVTMDNMLYHASLVSRAEPGALVVFDMPFMSYQESPEQAKHNAGRALKESGAEAVKLEGGVNMASTIEAIVRIDIPVMGHIGLTPQSIHRIGGYKVQGREDAARAKLLADARAVEESGAFAVVLELVPVELAAEITSMLSIPTIGIGSGADCDGQVLVMHDLLGIYPETKLRFVKQYADLYNQSKTAIENYCRDVRAKNFPEPKHGFLRNEKKGEKA